MTSSGSHLICRDRRRTIGPDQLRPDAVPVVWAKIPAHHLASGGPLDRDTALEWHLPDASCPLPDQLRCDPEGIGNRCLPTSLGIDVVGQIHPIDAKRGALFGQARRSLPYLSATLPIGRVKTVDDIRRENLERLIEEAGTLDLVAEKVDSSSVYLSQIRNRAIDVSTGRPRAMGTRMARRLEVAFDKVEGWLDTEPADDAASAPGTALADAISKMGPQARRETLEFIRYKIERSRPHFTNEEVARYSKAIDTFDDRREKPDD